MFGVFGDIMFSNCVFIFSVSSDIEFGSFIFTFGDFVIMFGGYDIVLSWLLSCTVVLSLYSGVVVPLFSVHLALCSVVTTKYNNDDQIFKINYYKHATVGCVVRKNHNTKHLSSLGQNPI